MTPDLTTPEGRAELRALIAKAQPGPWFLEKQRGYCDTYVKTAHPDWAPTEKGPHKNFIAEFGLGNEPTGHFYDQNAEMVCAAVNGLTALLDALDAAYAQIERLAAPVTEADLEAIYIFYDPNIERLVLRDVLDAFLASRKEPAP